MYLFINNMGQDGMVLGFKQDQKIFWLNLFNPQNQKERILLGMDNFLKKHKKTLKSLKGIVVVNGPGFFTGIRAALSVSNTLAWVLKIPVIGVNLMSGANNQDLFKRGLKELLKDKSRRLVTPFYGKEPNITLPKTR